MIKEINNKAEFLEATKEGRALVDFYAVWCGPCKMLAPVLEGYAKENPQIDLLRIDVDRLGDVAAMYGVSAIPTLVYFENGKAIDTHVGYASLEKIKSLTRN